MGKHNIIDIDDKIWALAKAISSMNNISLKRYIEEALKESIEKDLPKLKEFLGV